MRVQTTYIDFFLSVLTYFPFRRDCQHAENVRPVLRHLHDRRRRSETIAETVTDDRREDVSSAAAVTVLPVSAATTTCVLQLPSALSTNMRFQQEIHRLDLLTG